jgi:hypothetical protein
MAGIETIVRPFETPNSLARRRLVATNTKIPVSPARISWGSAGTLASAHQVEEVPTDGSFTVLKCDDAYQEIKDSRKVDVRRIVQVLERDASGNPTKTNPDNFIDLERPYRVFFEKVELALFAYIEGYYNRQRRHSAIGYITPEQAEAKSA